MECNVKIINMQQATSNADESEKTELITTADFKYENSRFYLTYDESILSECDETVETTLELGADYVILTRRGIVTSEMIFIKDRHTLTQYNTPYGEIHINIFTSQLYVDIDESGGNVSIDYVIDYENKYIIKNELKIHISEV